MKELIKLHQERKEAKQALDQIIKMMPCFPDPATFKTWDEQQKADHMKELKKYEDLATEADQKVKLIDNTIKIRKRALEYKLCYIANQYIKNLNLDGVIVDKRKLNKLIDAIKNDDMLAGLDISIYQDSYFLKIIASNGYERLANRDVALFERSKDNWDKYMFSVKNCSDISIKTNNEYKKLVKQALKKQKQLNDKLAVLSKEAETYCNQFEEETGAYISNYAKDGRYNFFRE